MKNKQCRMCKSTNVIPFLNMGKQPLVNSLLSKEDLDKKEEAYKLVVSFCKDCGLVQIVNPISSKKIYQDVDYLYFSSDMPKLKEYFEEYVNKSVKKYLNNNDLVVEIGSNDGILLDVIKNEFNINGKVLDFQFPGIRVLGIDPATNVVLRALKKGVPTIPVFFTEKIAEKVVNEWGKAKVIVANNCIAHLDDLHDLMKGVDKLLTNDGVFIVEANYWGGMINNCNYSLIYHDHFSYFSFSVWQKFLEQFGFELIDAIVTEAQGGSMRMTIGRKGVNNISDSVNIILAEESRQQLNTLQACILFADEVKKAAKVLRKLVKKIIKNGGKIAGYGAAAKGFTILNMSKLGKNELVCCVDDSLAKQDKFVPLNHIPILSRQDAENLEFNYFMILPWNYRQIIIDKEINFRNKGGKFIIPVGDIGVI